ncbi:MAG: hypothetical protein HZB14_03130 [Actinobacteria bacterium]|nr:hypothetical protein [Actinomycetota bacterium]
MISSAIRVVSKAVCVLLIASFTMFVVDELSTASNQQLAAVNGAKQAQVARDVHGREINPAQSQLRAKIDKANDQLTGTAEQFVAGQDPWVMRGFAFLVGMLLFGLGGHFIANAVALWGRPTRPAAPIDSEFRTRYSPGYR